jgi:hypothetical protein
MGPHFGVARTAVINASGSIDGAIGNLSDCVHVDGTSGACGGSGSSGTGFIDAEIPGGTLDGVNATFTLANTPNPSTSTAVYRNGLLLKQSGDYNITTNSILFVAGAIPQPADSVLVSYRIGVTIPGVGFVDGETPGGAIDGANTSFTLAQTPVPAASLAVYRNGMRIRSGLDYTSTGSSITFVANYIPQIGDVLQCSYRIAQ